MTTNLTKICEYENILTNHLSTCQKPRSFSGDNLKENLPCKYMRIYPLGKFCQKRKELRAESEYKRFNKDSGYHTGCGM